MNRDKNTKNAGYMTVEAVLVFVSILIIIFAIIYSLFLVYQSIILVNAATVGAQESAYIISSSQQESISESDIKSIVERELKRGFFKSSDTEINISQYGMLQKMIRVDLEYTVNFPMRNIAEMIAGDDIMTFKASSVARANNRVSNIRSIDFIKEIGQRIINDISSFTWGLFEGLLSK